MTLLKKLSVLLAMLSASPIAVGSELTDYDKILYHVIKLQPALKLKQAVTLAKAIDAVSSEPGAPVAWPILLSMAFQESSLIKNKVGRKTIRGRDFGLMQINEITLRTLGLDRNRLKTDEKYALRAANTILKENKKAYSKRYKYWLGFYNSGLKLSDKNIVTKAIKYDKVIRLRAARLFGYREKTHEQNPNRKRLPRNISVTPKSNGTKNP